MNHSVGSRPNWSNMAFHHGWKIIIWIFWLNPSWCIYPYKTCYLLTRSTAWWTSLDTILVARLEMVIAGANTCWFTVRLARAAQGFTQEFTCARLGQPCGSIWMIWITTACFLSIPLTISKVFSRDRTAIASIAKTKRAGVAVFERLTRLMDMNMRSAMELFLSFKTQR